MPDGTGAGIGDGTGARIGAGAGGTTFTYNVSEYTEEVLIGLSYVDLIVYP